MYVCGRFMMVVIAEEVVRNLPRYMAGGSHKRATIFACTFT
jgi:hypothetical protein